VAGICPNDGAILRLVGVVLMETHDEWQVYRAALSLEGSMAAILASGSPASASAATPALLAS
jgi:hypothetical protein